MSYKIVGTRQLEDTLQTEVEFVIGQDTVQVTISHFQPQAKEEVLAGISNRFLSEQKKLNAEKTIVQIIPQLAIGQIVPIDVEAPAEEQIQG